METIHFKTVDPVGQELLRAAAHKGFELVWERFEAQQPQDGFLLKILRNSLLYKSLKSQLKKLPRQSAMLTMVTLRPEPESFPASFL